MGRHFLVGFMFVALAGMFVAASPLVAAEKADAGKSEVPKDGNKTDKPKADDKEKKSTSWKALLDKEGSFSSTKATEKWLRFETTGQPVRITWSAAAGGDSTDHAASLLRLVLMYEVGHHETVQHKSWKVYETIVDRAAAGDSNTGTVELPQNTYAIVASGSNISYHVKVESIVK